ncbi:MAG: hypothetical protein EBW39_13130 [Betaproteobacteria bacterium]|nr:hypothetical protein [Betaproteobacteria bacterium]
MQQSITFDRSFSVRKVELAIEKALGSEFFKVIGLHRLPIARNQSCANHRIELRLFMLHDSIQEVDDFLVLIVLNVEQESIGC